MAVRGLDERAGTILCAGVEHSAVRQSSARTAPLAEIPVDRYGRVRPEAVEQAAAQVDGVVGLVHCQWANHEVGTLQPVAEVAEVAHRLGALVHVDGAAAVGHVAGAVAELGADLFSFSSHKLGGPTGVGVLVVRRGLRLEPYLVGGEQERGRRGGLENLAGAVGLAGALAELDPPTHVAEIERARRHTERVIDLVRSIDGTELYGDPERRAPHIVCFGVEGVEAEAVVISLDQAGVAVHSGSACSSESFEPSPVLAAMGVDADRSIRVSVGWNTVEEDLDALEATLPDVVGRLRSLRTA